MRKIENKFRLLIGIFFLAYSVYVFLSEGSPILLLFMGPTSIWFISDGLFPKNHLNRVYNPGTWIGTLFLGVMTVYTYVFQPAYVKFPVFYIFPIIFIFMLGVAVYEHQRVRKYQKAVEPYENALKIDPEDVTAWNNKGTAVAEFKIYSEAIKCFNRAIELNPKGAAALYNTGIILMELGNLQEAIKYYNAALDMDPGFKNAKKSGEIILEIN